MGNLSANLKKFLSNKNTVTIICVVAGILVLYIGYTWRVNDAINPTTIPYAKTALSSRHVITNDDIGYMEVSNAVISKSTNMIRNANQLIGKEVMYGTTIPQNSFFYTETIVSPDSQPDSTIADIPDGYTLFDLPVDLHSTYGNSIFPGNYIDLWFKGMNDYNRLMYTNLISSIKVLDVRDSQGQSVFETSTEKRTPADLLFAVPDDMYSLLRKAQYLTSYGVEIIPVPRNKNYTANPGETEVASDYVKNFILSKTEVIPDEEMSSSSSNNNNNSHNFNIINYENNDDEEEDNEDIEE